MGFIMPEIVIQKILKQGIAYLRTHPDAFDDIFAQYAQDELAVDYGPAYINEIRDWFNNADIPVLAAWALNIQKIPSISVHLANETEDESKAAMQDIFGDDEVGEKNTAVFTAMIDIGIHANRSGDNVLWLYYIVSYILFKFKANAHRLGLKLQTYSASDYTKEAFKMTDNIWTRWIRFRCTTENFWQGDDFLDIDNVNLDHAIGLQPPASQVSTSLDVDPATVDPTVNEGFEASNPFDPDDEDTVPI